jgi:hypothetical protein
MNITYPMPLAQHKSPPNVNFTPIHQDVFNNTEMVRYLGYIQDKDNNNFTPRDLVSTPR